MHPRAGTVALPEDLIDTGALVAAYYDRTPDPDDWQRLSSSWRPRLDARIALLEALRDNLDGCIGCGCLSLQSCRLLNPGDIAGEEGPGARWLVDRPD